MCSLSFVFHTIILKQLLSSPQNIVLIILAQNKYPIKLTL